jgi:hypothetical protein
VGGFSQQEKVNPFKPDSSWKACYGATSLKNVVSLALAHQPDDLSNSSAQQNCASQPTQALTAPVTQTEQTTAADKLMTALLLFHFDS